MAAYLYYHRHKRAEKAAQTTTRRQPVKRKGSVSDHFRDRSAPLSKPARSARPAWLDHAHKALDEAVAEAYGWGDDWRAGKLTDDEILARLFRLNQRAG